MVLDDEVDDQIPKDTIVHELLHTIPGCLTHKDKWRLHAEYVNKKLPQYSIKRAFKGNEGGLKIKRKKPVYKYVLRCTKCGQEIKRQKESKVIMYYKNYMQRKRNSILRWGLRTKIQIIRHNLLLHFDSFLSPECI